MGKDWEGLGSGGELGKLDALCGGTLRKLELTDSMPSVGSTPGSGNKSHTGQTIGHSCSLFPAVSMVPPLSERSDKSFCHVCLPNLPNLPNAKGGMAGTAEMAEIAGIAEIAEIAETCEGWI